MKKLKIFAVLFTVGFAMTSCKKETTNNNSGNNSNNNNPPANALCNGGSEQSFFPLKDKNSWTYKSALGSTIKGTVSGTQTFAGNTYFKIAYTESIGNSFERYYRKASNNDIYVYSTSKEQEFMEVPDNPAVNMEWAYPAGIDPGLGKRKITSVTSQVKTTSCTYTGCIIINEYDATGDLLTTYYYKKGVGLVRSFTFGNTDLTGATLN